MARKRKKNPSYDIRPKSAHVRKPWADLASSSKSYWRRKLDVRPISVRRYDPLDRIRTSTARARYTRTEYLSPYQRRIVRDTGVRYEAPKEDIYDEDELAEEAAEYKRGNAPYGYWVEDFLAIDDHPDGYSYVTYHIFISPTGSQGGNNVPQTVRGQQYNTVDDVRDGWKDEVIEIEHEHTITNKVMFYVGTIVAVIPASGAERVGGAVYPEDYHPKERPGTREYEIEEGKKRLRGFGPPLR